MMADQPRMHPETFLKVKPGRIGSIPDPNETASIKLQVELEIHNIKRCTYKVFECPQLRLDGYEYCQRHILNDKNAPYKQCAFIYGTNGKRCHLPTPKHKKDPGYCNEHALKTQLQNYKRSSHGQPPHTAEVLLHSLAHYIRKPRSRTVSGSSDDSNNVQEDNEIVITKSLNPFVDVDVDNILSTKNRILEMCSDPESDVDTTSFGSLWHDIQAESSDNDSIDSEQEDVLKHASIYSGEEITLIARDKLMRLQSLYKDQYCYLHHMLRERRRTYLHALKREKDTHCSIANQTHETAKERRLYKKLKAYKGYHKVHGDEAICKKRLHELRLKVTDGVTPKPHAFTKCVFTEGGVKCGERALPVTRHCRKHILEDTNQVLFRACGKIQSEMECTTPVEAIFDNTTCTLHKDIPEIRSYSHTRKDSESDYEEPLEAPMHMIGSQLLPNEEIKSEIEINMDDMPLAEFAVKIEENDLEEIKTEPLPISDYAINSTECAGQDFNSDLSQFDDVTNTNIQMTGEGINFTVDPILPELEQNIATLTDIKAEDEIYTDKDTCI